ncbi:MAG: hypothetical protein AB7R55_02110 [Gemmatimonadales bacterium]
MAISLRSLTFRHDPGNPAVSALVIRQNKDFEVPVPEYDSAAPVPPAESCAAYAIEPTAGHPVVVHAVLESPTPLTGDYEIRARGGGVLGRIPKTLVTFGGGTAVSVALPLSRRRFRSVGRHDVRWRWWIRKIGGGWQPLATTRHRIYLTLDVPTAPWNQIPADKHNPWTDLLDECCDAAAGSRTDDRVATALTQRIHLGYPLKYDIRWGAPRYGFGGTGGSFHLTEWIQYVLRGQAPASPTFCQGDLHEYPDFDIVNCYDCAAALAIMARALGTPLGYHFHGPFGYLEYVRPIGRGKCNNPFPGCSGTDFAVGPDDSRTGFGNHAYTKLAGQNDYDACMREWVPWWTRLLLLWLWAPIYGLTFGLVDLVHLRRRADGWLVDLPQPSYEQRTIDTSAPFEAAAAGGSPAPVPVDFTVT